MARQLSPSKNAPEHDIVYTPRPLAKAIIDHFSMSGVVLDPSSGDGAFFDQLPSTVDKKWCEIDRGVDFFEYKEKVDWIITNPPWSKIKEFLKHGVSISDNIVFLVTINHFMTKARMRLLTEAEFGFKEIYGVETPKLPWPQSGFQLAAVHVQRGWKDGTNFTGRFGK